MYDKCGALTYQQQFTLFHGIITYLYMCAEPVTVMTKSILAVTVHAVTQVIIQLMTWARMIIANWFSNHLWVNRMDLFLKLENDVRCSVWYEIISIWFNVFNKIECGRINCWYENINLDIRQEKMPKSRTMTWVRFRKYYSSGTPCRTMGGERDAGYHLNEGPKFQRKSPRTVTRAFQRDDSGVEKVATEHFFVTSKGNENFNPRSIAEELARTR